MKKAVFVVLSLSFCAANVLGMPSDKKRTDERRLSGEPRGGVVADFSTSPEERNVHKRKLSRTSEEDREVQRRREEVKDTTHIQVTESQKVAGLRKRIEKKEKENESLSQEIRGCEDRILVLERENAGLNQDVESKELVIRSVNDYLDSSMEKCEKRIMVDQMFADLWRCCDTNVVEKAKVLVSAIISKVSDLQRENIENKAEIRLLQSEFQKRDSENKAEIRKLQEQIDQLKRGFPNREDEVEKGVMDVDEGMSSVILPQGASDFFVQKESIFDNRNSEAFLSGGVGNRNAAREIAVSKEEQATGSSSGDKAARENEEIFNNARLGVKIKGRFVDGYLDLSSPVSFEGCYVKEQEFVFSGQNSEKIKISKKDLSNAERIREPGNFLSLLSAEKGNSITFCKEFVYKGEVEGGGNPSGLGIMLTSTGEIVEGRFSVEGWKEKMKL